MRKILFLVLVLIGSNVIEAYSSIIIVIKIARHRDCLGLGFCEIKIGGDPAPLLAKEGKEARAIVDLNRNKHLVLSLDKNKDMLPATFDKYFSKGSFIFEDDFPVPDEILRALKYSGSYTIKAGEYPIKMKKDLITIEF